MHVNSRQVHLSVHMKIGEPRVEEFKYNIGFSLSGGARAEQLKEQTIYGLWWARVRDKASRKSQTFWL